MSRGHSAGVRVPVALRCTLGCLCLQLVIAPHNASAQRSVDVLRAAVLADSNDALLHFELARALIARKQWAAADTALQTTTMLAPGHGDAWMERALLPARRGAGYLRQLEKSGVSDSVRQVTERYRRLGFFADPTSELRQAEIMKRYLPGPSERRYASDRTHLLIRIIKLTADGRTADAYREFGKLGSVRTPLLAHLRGLLALQEADYASAIQDFGYETGAVFRAESLGTVLALSANEPRFALATSYLMAGQFERAANTYLRVLELDPSAYQAHSQLAIIYEASGMWEEAEEERRRAIMANPAEPALEVDLAKTLLLAGRAEDALGLLEQAEVKRPRDPRAPWMLAAAHDTLGHVAAAADARRRFLAIAPLRLAAMRAEAEAHLRTVATAGDSP